MRLEMLKVWNKIMTVRKFVLENEVWPDLAEPSKFIIGNIYKSLFSNISKISCFQINKHWQILVSSQYIEKFKMK